MFTTRRSKKSMSHKSCQCKRSLFALFGFVARDEMITTKPQIKKKIIQDALQPQGVLPRVSDGG